MTSSMSLNETEQKSFAQPFHRLWWGVGIVSGIVFAVLGSVLLVTAFATSSGGIFKGIQVVFSIGVVAAGVLILRVFLNGQYRSRGVGLLAGEIALACAFLYLGVAMPLFHQGLASPGIARIQFIVILASFVFGTGALALSGISKQSRPLGLVTFPSMVRDGVILLTGTVLLAITIGQLSGAALLLLIGRGAFKLAFSHRDNRLSYRIISKLFYVIAVVLFIYGERSVISGQAPHFIAGGAAPIVALFLLGACLLLTIGRATSQKVCPAYSAPGDSTERQTEEEPGKEKMLER